MSDELKLILKMKLKYTLVGLLLIVTVLVVTSCDAMMMMKKSGKGMMGYGGKGKMMMKTVKMKPMMTMKYGGKMDGMKYKG